MNAPLSYFELVVKTVRGMSPVPEFQSLMVDRSALAREHINSLKAQFNHEPSGNMLIDTIINEGEGLLCQLWDRLNPIALTMCGDKNLEILIEAMRTVETEGVAGDFIETGVWRGGLPIIMRAFLHSRGNTERLVWIADSFAGLPNDAADPLDQAAHLLLEPLAHLTAFRKQVEQSLDYFGLLDEQVQFLEGWFKDTLRTMPDRPLALVRLDGDYYESTKDAVEALYPKLSQGGYLIVDDYNLPLGSKRAIDEYRDVNNIVDPIIPINGQSVYWRKS